MKLSFISLVPEEGYILWWNNYVWLEESIMDIQQTMACTDLLRKICYPRTIVCLEFGHTNLYTQAAVTIDSDSETLKREGWLL